MTRIIIFPPNNTLSPKLELPVSEQMPAVNSIKYQTPMIFKRSVYKLEFKPVIPMISLKTSNIVAK